MRNARVFFPQSRLLSAVMTFALASTFSVGETESSMSRNTRSALLAAAFSIMRSLLAGVDNLERLRRILEGTHPKIFVATTKMHVNLLIFFTISLFFVAGGPRVPVRMLCRSEP